MFARSLSWPCLLAMLVAFSSGCKKQSAPADAVSTNSAVKVATAPAPAAETPDTSLRLHWLGLKRLGNETNAAYFMSIWNLSESRRLESQTLDKTALWLANFQPTGTNREISVTNSASLVASNATAALLRPLVEDLLKEESFIEVRQPTNEAAELALAIRLDDQQAARWQTNLAAAQNGLRKPLGTVSVSRSGPWTLVETTLSASSSSNRPAPISESQLATLNSQRSTNYWVDARIDFLKLASLFTPGQGAPPAQTNTTASLAGVTNLPTVSLTMIGDGQNVRTRAELDFPHPLPLEMDAWNIPTNLIHDPLIGFTAIRSLRPFLKNFKPWNDLQLGTPPNQAYFWANQGLPQSHFMAMPSAEASAQVAKLSDYAVNDLDRIFSANPLKPGGFTKSPTTHRLVWQGIPLFSPTVEYIDSGKNPVIFAGFTTNLLTRLPAPPELLQQVYRPKDLVYYDWEVTGPCIQGLTPMSQLVRRAFNLPRLPSDPSVAWLLALIPKLMNSATVITTAHPSQLLVVRKSSLGLTAAELELIADWLQSPDFPGGLYSFHTQ